MNMLAPVDILKRMPFLIGTMVVVGAMLGGVVAPAVQGAMDAYDRGNPVLIAKATVVESSAEDVVVHLSGEKRRDCQYISLQAYTRAAAADGMWFEAYMRRVDKPESGVTRPLGEYATFGLWRIWPRGQAGVVAIYAQHACGGRLVLSKLAEVML